MMRKQDLNHQQRSADDDRTIRQIEDRPLVRLHVEQQEIHAPPRISESAIPVMVSARACLHSSTDTITIAISENPINSAVFQCDGESANKLNAAPVFSVCVIRKNPGMTWMCVD